MAASADIDEWSRRMTAAFDDAARSMGNEAEFREHVHAVVMAAIGDLYSLTAAASSAERNPSRGSRLRFDRLYAGVVVEWEWNMGAARREHGAQQALEYLELLRRDRPAADAFTAVVADGQQWGFLVVDPDAERDLFSEGPTTAAGHFLWRENSAAACRQFLELVGSHERSPITPRTLTATFGPSSVLAHRFVSVLAQSLAGRAQLDRSDTLYREWRRALDVVYGDLDKADGHLADVVQDAYDVPISRSVGELLWLSCWFRGSIHAV